MELEFRNTNMEIYIAIETYMHVNGRTKLPIGRSNIGNFYIFMIMFKIIVWKRPFSQRQEALYENHIVEHTN